MTLKHQAPLEYEINYQQQAIDEAQVARYILGGNKNAFDYFIQRYGTPLFNYIYRVLSDTELASDILQIVFMRFYTSLPQLNLEKSFKPWLFHVAHNCCMDELRSQRRHKTYPFSTILVQDEENNADSLLEIEDTHTNTEVISEQHDLQETLQKALLILPIKAREVVILRYTSNMTFSQIAQVLQMPEPTAKTYFSRARKTLKKALIKEGIISSQQ